MRFTGIIPPVATIFHADHSFNPQGMANMIDANIKGGVDGPLSGMEKIRPDPLSSV